MPRALELRADIVAAVRGAGYTYVTLDLEGFRSGNLNAALAPPGSVADAPRPTITKGHP
jgi:uncharacterized protein